MSQNKQTIRKCPYCKEDINSLAIKCKYCYSEVQPEKPSHGGTCPYCKEDVNPEAIKCKHCKSDLIINLRHEFSTSNIIGMPSSVSILAAIAPDIPNGGGDDNDSRPRGICFYILVPDCRIIEDIDPIASFKPPRLECNGWRWVKVCIPNPFPV